MSDEKNKGKSFKSLFFKEDPPSQSNSPVTSNTGFVGSQNPTIPYVPAVPVNSNLAEDFQKKLQQLINDNNQPGFDFLEFTESLFETSANPDPAVYQMIFNIAQKMDKSLTPAKLIESANFYKNLVDQAATAKINEGMQKKASLQGEKETERGNLQTSVDTLNKKIETLTKQINDLRGQAATAGNELATIDQKYQQQMTEIDTKIAAINTARENVISSIVDVESGIQNNIK